MNIPEKCAYCFLIPPSIHITQTISNLRPTVSSAVDANKSMPSSVIGNGRFIDCCLYHALLLTSIQFVCPICFFYMAGDSQRLYKSNYDQLFDDWNMATIVSLLNFLDVKLVWFLISTWKALAQYHDSLFFQCTFVCFQNLNENILRKYYIPCTIYYIPPRLPVRKYFLLKYF